MDLDPYLLAVHLASKHPGAEDYNEKNFGLGLRTKGLRDLPDEFMAAGGYKNSVGKDSFYAGYGKNLFSLGPMDVNAMGGLVTGYPDMPVAPFLIPEAVFDVGKGYKVMLNYIPSLKHGDTKVDQAIGLSLGIPLK